MGRPSNRQERQAQILEAYERCVIRYGLEGATLQAIADEAGLARPLVRHHAGNRSDLEAALLARFLERSDAGIEELVAALPEERPADALLEILFVHADANADDVILAEALIAGGRQNADLAKAMHEWVEGFIAVTKDALRRQYPQADAADIDIVGTGITGIYFNADSFGFLDSIAKLRAASYEASRRLMATLE